MDLYKKVNLIVDKNPQDIVNKKISKLTIPYKTIIYNPLDENNSKIKKEKNINKIYIINQEYFNQNDINIKFLIVNGRCCNITIFICLTEPIEITTYLYINIDNIFINKKLNYLNYYTEKNFQQKIIFYSE